MNLDYFPLNWLPSQEGKCVRSQACTVMKGTLTLLSLKASCCLLVSFAVLQLLSSCKLTGKVSKECFRGNACSQIYILQIIHARNCPLKLRKGRKNEDGICAHTLLVGLIWLLAWGVNQWPMPSSPFVTAMYFHYFLGDCTLGCGICHTSWTNIVDLARTIVLLSAVNRTQCKWCCDISAMCSISGLGKYKAQIGREEGRNAVRCRFLGDPLGRDHSLVGLSVSPFSSSKTLHTHSHSMQLSLIACESWIASIAVDILFTKPLSKI